MVLAHPDDEVIFGWPLLQDSDIEKEILICSSDLRNPLRKWCAHRKYDLAKLCSFLGIEHTCYDYDSEFYRANTRKQRRKGLERLLPKKPQLLLRHIAERIVEAVDASACDMVFTHNFWGEYGHMDHILVNSIVVNNTRKPVLMTGARIEAPNLPLLPDAPAWKTVLDSHFHSSHVLDLDFYERCAAFYKNSGTWTWSKPPLERLDLYMFPSDEAGNGRNTTRQREETNRVSFGFNNHTPL